MPRRPAGWVAFTGWPDIRKRNHWSFGSCFDIYYENHTVKNSQFKLIKSRVDKDLTAFNGADNVSMGLDPAACYQYWYCQVLEAPTCWVIKVKEHSFNFKG
jgi:hypothetical protein